MNPPLQIAIIVFCVIMSAYFSATETAFSTMNRIRVKNLAEKGNKKAALVLKLSDNYDKLISTILIGNNIVNLLASSMATLVFIHFLTKPLDNNQDLISLISTLVLTLVILTFGEISPKTVAKKRPEGFAMFSAPLINFFTIILTPISFLFNLLQKLLAKLFKDDDDQGMTEDELISIIEEAEEEGDIDKEESTLIKSAIEFNDLEVGDIYTPRIDITAVPFNATRAEIGDIFSDSGYSRIPVYEGDIDNIVGILYYKDFYNRKFNKIDEIIKPVIYVAKSQKINELLKDLQNKQLHLAVVMDEYGSTAGIVTLEDILEEIVGEIWDEHDEKIEEFKETGEKEYTATGKANLSKLLGTLDIEPEEEPDVLTVNGWAMTELGRLPEEGDEFESYGLHVKVLKMDGRRVDTVHITDVRPSEEDEEDGDKEDDDKKEKETSDR